MTNFLSTKFYYNVAEVPDKQMIAITGEWLLWCSGALGTRRRTGKTAGGTPMTGVAQGTGCYKCTREAAGQTPML